MDGKKTRRHLVYHRRSLIGRRSRERRHSKSIFSRSKTKHSSSSSFFNSDLRANNRSLARALADTRMQFGLAHEQNLQYQFEIQTLKQRINKFQQRINLQPGDLERENYQRYKNMFIQMEDGLNNVGDKLIEAVDILSTIAQSCRDVIDSEGDRLAILASEESAFEKHEEGDVNNSNKPEFEIKTILQSDNSKLLTDAVKSSMSNMSVIMEQSEIKDEESISEEISEGQEDAVKYSNHEQSSTFLNSPPLIFDKEVSEGESFEKNSRPSEEYLLPSVKPLPLHQTRNQILISKDKKILNSSITPPSPKLSIDIDAELKKYNAKYNAVEESYSTPSSRQETFMIKQKLPYSLDTGIPQGQKTQTELFSPKEQLGNIEPNRFSQNASFTNNSEIMTTRKIPLLANETEPRCSSSYINIANSKISEKNDELDIANNFNNEVSDLRQSVHEKATSKQKTVFNNTRNSSLIFNDEINNSLEFTALTNSFKAKSKTINSLTSPLKTHLSSIKETFSDNPKEIGTSKRKRTIRETGKPKRVKKTKKHPSKMKKDNEVGFIPNLLDISERFELNEKENADLMEIDSRGNIDHLNHTIGKKTENAPIIKRLYYNTPEKCESRRLVFTPSNKQSMENEKIRTSFKFISKKEAETPVIDDTFSKINSDTGTLNNIETIQKEWNSTSFNYNRNSSISSKSTMKAGFSNPSTPAVFEDSSFRSSNEGSERRPRRARALAKSYKQLPLNLKMRRP